MKALSLLTVLFELDDLGLQFGVLFLESGVGLVAHRSVLHGIARSLFGEGNTRSEKLHLARLPCP